MTPAPREKPKARGDAIFPSQLLAANIRATRALLNLSQQDLAARMSALGHQWSRPTVSQVERATRAVSVDELYGLAHALTTDILMLLSPPEAPRILLDTGLPHCLSAQTAKGMFTHNNPESPHFMWNSNELVAGRYDEDDDTWSYPVYPKL